MKPRALLDPRKQPHQERARMTMEAIIVAGIRVLEREGLAQLNTTRVADVAGVSVGSLYQYFQNREAIIGAIIDRQLEETLVAFNALVANLADLALEPAIRHMLFGLLEAARAHEKLHAPLYEEMSAARRTTRHWYALDAYVGVVATVLKLRGDIAVSDPWAAARLIVHAGHGVIRSLVVTADPSSTQIMLDEAVRMITRYLAPLQSDVAPFDSTQVS